MNTSNMMIANRIATLLLAESEPIIGGDFQEKFQELVDAGFEDVAMVAFDGWVAQEIESSAALGAFPSMVGRMQLLQREIDDIMMGINCPTHFGREDQVVKNHYKVVSFIAHHGSGVSITDDEALLTLDMKVLVSNYSAASRREFYSHCLAWCWATLAPPSGVTKDDVRLIDELNLALHEMRYE